MEAQGFDLTEEEIDSEAFRDFFARTMECILRARRGDKIARFAAITCNFREITWGDSEDTGEEIQRTLDGLSDREWQTLVLLNDYERARPSGTKPSDWARGFWESFKADVKRKGVRADELAGFMAKLAGTGCFMYFEVWGDNDGLRIGHTTPYFDRLLLAVARKSGVYPHGPDVEQEMQ